MVAAPVQHARMKFGIDRRIAAVGIDAERRGRMPAGDRVTDLAGDRDRPDPGQRIRKIAETFAEIDRRRVGVERIGADARDAAAAPFDGETDRHHELMLRIPVDAVFERGLPVLESAGAGSGRTARPTEKAVGRAERNREILGDPFGEFSGNIALPERRIVAGLETGDGRKRQLVVDAGIVDPERCRKEAIADDFVRNALAEGNERDGEP